MNPLQKPAPRPDIPVPFADPSQSLSIALARGLCEGGFVERYLKGAQSMSAELGIQLAVFDAHGDQTRLAAMTQDAVRQHVDAIIIDHGQEEVMQPAIQAALEQGIQIVAFDLIVDNPTVPEIEQDDMLIGFLLSEQLAIDYGGNANVIYINADGYAPLEKRDRIWEVFKWRYSGLNEVARMGAVTDKTAADTQAHLEALLQAHPETDAIIAMWDEFAKGAVRAVTQAGLSDRIKVYSVDITNQDIQMMTEPGSPWAVTVATDAYNIGRLAVRAAAARIAGEKMDKYLLVKPSLITREILATHHITNMNELLETLPGLGESHLLWFDWMNLVLARNGYSVSATRLSPEQLLAELQATLGTLQERNTALQAAVEVSHAASGILNPTELMQKVVDLIRVRFGLYYVGLFQVDEEEEEEWAVLRAGSGEAGQAMPRLGHRLKIGGESMVGWSIANAQTRIAQVTEENATRLVSPELPDTRSEAALPLLSAGEILGALTVQSDQPDAFDEDAITVLQSLANQVAVAMNNARHFQEIIAANTEVSELNERLKVENLRMEAELDVTRRLQQMLLPGRDELKQIDDLDIVGFMQPADEVGGDYYDVLRQNGNIKISIGDVTGHGLESGVVMLMLQTAVRTLLTSGEHDPKRFMNIINRTLYDNIKRMKVDKSLSLIVLDLEQGRIRLSGQHEQLIVVRSPGQVELMDTMDLGFPVGLLPDIGEFVQELPLELASGDGVVLYSDGFTEAGNEAEEFYGLERLCAVISQHWSQTAEQIKEAVVADVQQFIGQQKVYDDLCLLVVKKK